MYCIHYCCIYCIQIDNVLKYSIIVYRKGVANKLSANVPDAGVPYCNFSGDTLKASTEEILEGVILEMKDLQILRYMICDKITIYYFYCCI